MTKYLKITFIEKKVCFGSVVSEVSVHAHLALIILNLRLGSTRQRKGMEEESYSPHGSQDRRRQGRKVEGVWQREGKWEKGHGQASLQGDDPLPSTRSYLLNFHHFPVKSSYEFINELIH